MISIDDVKKLANLARITLSSDEEATLAKDMEDILNYIGQLTEVTVEPKEKNNKKMNVRNVMREDNNPDNGGEHSEIVLLATPKRRGNFVVVKNIL